MNVDTQQLTLLGEERDGLISTINHRQLKIDDYSRRISLLEQLLQNLTQSNTNDLNSLKKSFQNLESDLSTATDLSQQIGELMSSSSSSLSPQSKQIISQSISQLMENVELAQNSESQSQVQAKQTQLTSQQTIQSQLNSVQEFHKNLLEQQNNDNERLNGISMEQNRLQLTVSTFKQRSQVFGVISQWYQTNVQDRLNMIQSTIEQCTEVLWNIELAKACFTP